jgi:hypothetical protein
MEQVNPAHRVDAASSGHVHRWMAFCEHKQEPNP